MRIMSPTGEYIEFTMTNPIKYIYSLPFRAKVKSLFRRQRCGELPTECGFVGETFVGDRSEVKIVLNAAGIKLGDKVLDIGCGAGRDVNLILQTVGRDGMYCGFDIVKSGIEYCRKQYNKYGCSFEHLDVYNSIYNPGGVILPSQLRFPYPSDTFDYAMANSVFTHMLPSGVERYLKEAHRVCKSSAKVGFTFFILDNTTIHFVINNECPWSLKHNFHGYRTHRKIIGQEGVVAYEKDFIEAMFSECGWKIHSFIRGTWYFQKHTQLTAGQRHQDVYILEKK